MPSPARPAARTVKAPPKPAADRAGVRVNLTLTPELVATLDRMTDVTGTGRATILREMLEASMETFTAMAEALELAKDRKTDAFKVLVDALDRGREEADQLSLDIKRTRRRAMRKKVAK